MWHSCVVILHRETKIDTLHFFKITSMERRYIISSKLVSRMRGMSEGERELMFNTFLCDKAHVARSVELSPVQELMYMFVREHIERDTARYYASHGA